MKEKCLPAVRAGPGSNRVGRGSWGKGETFLSVSNNSRGVWIVPELQIGIELL